MFIKDTRAEGFPQPPDMDMMWSCLIHRPSLINSGSHRFLVRHINDPPCLWDTLVIRVLPDMLITG